jgi:hypothetical protein
MTGSVRAIAKTGKVEGRVALPFGHPIPNKVRNSNALRELARTATYIAPVELDGMLRVFADSIVKETQKNWAVNKGALRKAERAEKRFQKEFERAQKAELKAGRMGQRSIKSRKLRPTPARAPRPEATKRKLVQ